MTSALARFGSNLAMVAMPVSLDTYPDVKTSAASLPRKSASSRSNSTSGWLVPEMLRVPPAPASIGSRARACGECHVASGKRPAMRSISAQTR